jgi:hypothetical protein
VGQVSSYQEAPYQGISQAPPQVRRKDQAEALEDCLVALPEGLQKRPPFQLVGILPNHPGSTGGVFHYVERLAGNAIFTVTREGAVSVPRVYDFASLARQPLTIDAGAQTYLNSGVLTPQHDIGCNTVVDYTFTWNRTKNVINAVTRQAARPFEALVWIRGGSYAKTYQIHIAGAASAIATVHTPDGTSASDGTYVDTEVIASALITGTYPIAGTNGAFVTGNLTAAGFTVTQIGPVISISHPTVDFTVTATDGQGGIAMIAAKGKVQKFADLPAKAPNGFTVRVIQQSGTNQDDYYVKFTRTAGDGAGVWEECLAPGALLGIDANSMPMGLVYDAGWKFKVLAWKQRTTGNEELVKDPDFVGLPVQDVTFWQGRLGIISGEGVTLSCADDPFQVYPRTLAILLDSDPIGRVNPAPGETTFRYAVPFEHRLVLCGDNIQAEVTADGVLTPTKAIIDVMTQHELNRFIRPAPVNGKLYFSSPKGITASGVTEIGVDRITNNPVGEDLTTAAFAYLPSGMDRSAVCPVLYTTVYGISGSSDLYVHLFRHDNQERVQNAFLRWHLPTGYALGGMFFVNTSLYVLACKGSVGYVFRMDLSPLVFDPGSSVVQTCIDVRATEAQCPSKVYDAGTDRTTVSLPFPFTASTVLSVRAPGGGPYSEGYVPVVDAASGGNSLVVVGNFAGIPFFVGYTYASKFDLSRLYVRDAKGTPIRNGRLQLRKIITDLYKTAYLRAEVTAAGRPTRKYEFFGFRYDDPAAHWDLLPNTTIPWTVPIMCENEQVDILIVNDSPFGHTLTGLEWVGEFNPRSQRT